MLAEEIADIDSILKELGIFLHDAELSSLKEGRRETRGEKSVRTMGCQKLLNRSSLLLVSRERYSVLTVHCTTLNDWMVGQLQAPSIQCAQNQWA
jgi:hypothetical protein